MNDELLKLTLNSLVLKWKSYVWVTYFYGNNDFVTCLKNWDRILWKFFQLSNWFSSFEIEPLGIHPECAFKFLSYPHSKFPCDTHFIAPSRTRIKIAKNKISSPLLYCECNIRLKSPLNKQLSLFSFCNCYCNIIKM
jgi:hypothetical protein